MSEPQQLTIEVLNELFGPQLKAITELEALRPDEPSDGVFYFVDGHINSRILKVRRDELHKLLDRYKTGYIHSNSMYRYYPVLRKR